MSLELTPDAIEFLIKNKMLEDIDGIDGLLTANVEYHHYNKGKPFAPMYSYDFDTELKKLKKMRKAFIKVHDWYSTTKFEKLGK
jgi:hypothetical protein